MAMPPEEHWRLFIAAELPADVAGLMAKAQEKLKAKLPAQAVRWTSPQGIHLTLKFLGDTPIQQIDLIMQKLAKALRGQAPIQLQARGMGCFPTLVRPRVIWIGLGGEITQLAIIASLIEQQLSPIGYPSDRKGFTPHLTLGRISEKIRSEERTMISTLIQKAGSQSLAEWTVDSISLMRSQIGPGGAKYETVGEVFLRQ